MKVLYISLLFLGFLKGISTIIPPSLVTTTTEKKPEIDPYERGIPTISPPDIMTTTTEKTPEIDPSFETPTFKWSSFDRSSAEPNVLHVRFNDGFEDTIELNRYDPLDLMKSNISPCAFMGYLKSEPESIVAVTGCPQDDEINVSILSLNREDITVTVNNKIGKSERIHNLVHQSNIDYVISNLQVENNYETIQDRAVLGLPTEFFIRMIVAYDSTFDATFASPDERSTYLTQLFTHIQAFYHHPSLQFKITLDTPLPIIDMTNEIPSTVTKALGKSLEQLQSLAGPTLKANGNGQLLAVFVNDQSNDSTLGIAYLGSLCDGYTEKYKVSINEYRSNVIQAAKIVTHELGHNFGIMHDDNNGVCPGQIMNAYINGGNIWSNCSNQWFASNYHRKVAQNGYFCAERSDPKTDGGSWLPWSRLSGCDKPCGGGTQSRTRTCVGTSCPGDGIDSSTKCNIEECGPCEDLPGYSCELRAQYNWCSVYSYMKDKCNKSCNIDKLSATACETYKSYGYCDTESNNFRYMMLYCGYTCQQYCFEER